MVNCKNVFRFLSLLRIDVYMFLYMFSFFLPMITLNQLVQDKICLNELKLSSQVCYSLEKSRSLHESEISRVLSVATDYKNYQTLVTVAPNVILSLFLGHWIDSYPGHLRYILAAPAFGSIITTSLIIYNIINFHEDPKNTVYAYISSGLTGGIKLVITASYIYTTRVTSTKFRAVRFAILEFFSQTAFPLATALGGKLLAGRPWFSGQYRNYLGVYLIALITNIVGMLWVLLLLYDAGSSVESKEKQKKVEEEIAIEETAKDGNKDELTIVSASVNEKTNNVSKESGKESAKLITILAHIFSLENIINMVRSCCRKRPNNGRARIWHVMICMTVVLFTLIGEHVIQLQFTQKVYSWDAEYFSYIQSALMMIPAIVQMIAPAILIHRFNISDTTIAGIGCISLISQFLIRGGFLESWAYFVSFVVGAFGGLLPIALRSLLSKLIETNEIGRVYSFLSVIDSFAPLLSSIFYSKVFNSTIDSHPGIVFYAVSLFLLYPLATVIWLEFTKNSWETAKINTCENIQVDSLKPRVLRK